MPFPFNVYLLSFGAGFLASLLSLPLWRAWSMRIGLLDDPGHRKIHATPVPLAGGLAVTTGLVLPLLVALVALHWQGLDAATINRLAYGFSHRKTQLTAILIGAVGMVLLGWLDDKNELSPVAKFAGQLLIAVLVAAAGVRVTLFVDSRFFSYAITILWILTVTNAFNFIDNMNGLCAGLGSIAAFCLAMSAAIQGQYLVAGIACLSCGAMLGFLPFNFPRATAFLGDAGSHLIGFLLAVLAILPHFYSTQNPRALAVFSPLLILAVPLGDLIWVVLLRLRLGKPFYVGDNNHLSHRLVRQGLSPTQAVLLLWLLAALLGSLCLQLF